MPRAPPATPAWVWRFPKRLSKRTAERWRFPANPAWERYSPCACRLPTVDARARHGAPSIARPGLRSCVRSDAPRSGPVELRQFRGKIFNEEPFSFLQNFVSFSGKFSPKGNDATRIFWIDFTARFQRAPISGRPFLSLGRGLSRR